MTNKTDDGGPAFPVPMVPCDNDGGFTDVRHQGVTVRDWFAAHIQADDRLVKCVRAMDDDALAILGHNAALFAKHPDLERDDWLTETDASPAGEWVGLSEVEKVYKRLALEAKAIAVVRYMQADAMMFVREART